MVSAQPEVNLKAQVGNLEDLWVVGDDTVRGGDFTDSPLGLLPGVGGAAMMEQL